MPVVDANVVIHGRGNPEGDPLLTVPGVMDEIRSSEARMKSAGMDLESRRPGEEELERVERKAGEIGSEVSETDKQLLALSIQADETLVTDDRDLQNLALSMDADFRGFLDDSVEEERNWNLECENCGREVSSSPCRHCGAEQVRRRQD